MIKRIYLFLFLFVFFSNANSTESKKYLSSGNKDKICIQNAIINKYLADGSGRVELSLFGLMEGGLNGPNSNVIILVTTSDKVRPVLFTAFILGTRINIYTNNCIDGGTFNEISFNI
ncbi:hypothetical protein [Xenorhabdus stockiae]|uniref:hypothetical protein n=1 Tax=Xenorhabdus stockiae TaxID=351614 RepID=UPI004064279D